MTVRSRSAFGRGRRPEGRRRDRRSHGERDDDREQHPPPAQHQGRDGEQSQADDDERPCRLEHDDEVCRRVVPAQRPDRDEHEQHDPDGDVEPEPTTPAAGDSCRPPRERPRCRPCGSAGPRGARRRVRSPRRPPAPSPQACSTTGMIIGRRRILPPTQRADRAADDLLELLVVADALGDGLLDGPLDLGDDLLEDLVVLDEPAGRDLRARSRSCRWPRRARRRQVMKPSSRRMRRSLSRASSAPPTLLPST